MTAPMLVQLTTDDLAAIVDKAVRAAVAPPESDVMTLDEVARLVRVEERTVLAYVKKQGLPAVKLPNGWRFFRSEVIAWMKGRK